MSNYIFNTKFSAKLKKNEVVQTILDVMLNLSSNIFNTNLITKLLTNNTINTNLSTRLASYTSIIPKNLNNAIVKKDGNELLDVDYNTLKIQFNLNRNPSQATFVLARHHDDIDHDLSGNVSTISAENKIQIYDGAILLFTGYITQIKSNSTTDTVEIVAQDVRYKISRLSMEISYGGKYDETTDIITKISTSAAIETVLSTVGGLISGHETLNFNFIPEYTTVTSDCSSLLDTLINNSGNINWYIDENEYLRLQKIERGVIKTLPLSGLSTHRHIYDTILNDIIMNRIYDNYYTSFKVHFGQQYTRRWIQSTISAGISYPEGYRIYPDTAKDITHYAFQYHHNALPGQGLSSGLVYCGDERTSIWSYIPVGVGSYMKGWFTVQWLSEDNYTDITPVIIGSGTAQKDLYLSSYGKKISNPHWKEQINTSTGRHWLTQVEEEKYDYTSYALDAANFELNQNNKLITEATVSIILDAFEYYGITLKDLINLSNTIESNCYVNNNGFPLNISGISIDLANRIVTMTLTNYGKSFYQRTGDYLLNYQTPNIKWLMPENPAKVGSDELRLIV